MIILDTHVWVWWVAEDPRLSPAHRAAIAASQASGVGVSAISCWEVAKLVQLGRLDLREPVSAWLDQAIAYPGCRELELTRRIAVESTTLPGDFHRDPADQIIVATARVWDCPLLTVDRKLLDYPYVTTPEP